MKWDVYNEHSPIRMVLDRIADKMSPPLLTVRSERTSSRSEPSPADPPPSSTAIRVYGTRSSGKICEVSYLFVKSLLSWYWRKKRE